MASVAHKFEIFPSAFSSDIFNRILIELKSISKSFSKCVQYSEFSISSKALNKFFPLEFFFDHHPFDDLSRLYYFRHGDAH